MLLSAVSVLLVAQSSSEIPEGIMNNPVLCVKIIVFFLAFLENHMTNKQTNKQTNKHIVCCQCSVFFLLKYM